MGQRLREWRLISALAAKGDARTILQQARAAAALLSRRRSPTSQLALPRVPIVLVARPDEPSPLKVARPDCKSCLHRQKKSGHDTRKTNGGGLRARGQSYGSPFGRVVEASIALVECDDKDPQAWRAAKERMRAACEAWIRKETA